MSTNPHQLFRISPGQMVYSAGGTVDPQRFLSDVNYLSPYAAGFAQCLGVKTIKHALIEDATSQTAFCYQASPDGIGSVINGIFTRQPEPPEALFNNLNED
jgi:hypothetical protein